MAKKKTPSKTTVAKKSRAKKTLSKKSPPISTYTLPQRLKYLRQLRGLSQAELAKKSGVSQSTVAQIEKEGKDPSISTLKKLATALDIDLAVFFATESVHVFDMQRLKAKYRNSDDLPPTLYTALGKVLQFARGIGLLES